MKNASLFILLLLSAPFAHREAVGQQVQEIRYHSSADDSQQPAMFYAPQTDTAVPLVVVLHSWSGDYKQRLHKKIEAWCVQQGWAYIHPNFRGPNLRPEATGSELVVQDIVSAVDHAKMTANIDPSAVYLIGTSGGGYTSLLMAGRHPEIWAGVSAWVPISDLTAWYHECKLAKRNYFNNIVASCGGVPGTSPEVDEEYRKRSPLTYLADAKGVRLSINAGIRDGHVGSVPVSHSLLAFNEVAEAADRLSEEQIRELVQTAKVPADLQTAISDPSFGEKQPLFRRTSGSATVTLFDGGHELVDNAAIAWIKQTYAAKGD
ncbi:Prolyl oligopeptidase family protein [Rosistilla ulvae]|uniref:Prolyl oligopeptidase family protein n=1 Tax=Rosistilla ulvae TaxID=1930277 RepID=A0A517M3U8_9BACT|nr:prolyl oligopeptidase family serine peptidase [Rosistilla ulvae]QDS89552.1 Prolyl oligopeptidase family protein [Rosistilla ulvae]